jgi:hypothetical protein
MQRLTFTRHTHYFLRSADGCYEIVRSAVCGANVYTAYCLIDFPADIGRADTSEKAMGLCETNSVARATGE